MIHCTREERPNFEPDPGRTRTLITAPPGAVDSHGNPIGARWVEWSGVKPTPQDLADHINPPPAMRQAQANAEADAALTATGNANPLLNRDHPEMVLIRRLRKSVATLVSILQTKGTLNAADLAAIKNADL